jgi:MFS family permease
MKEKQFNLDQINLSKSVSKHNFYSFLMHAIFLALAMNFMDVDTIIPAMLIESGGSSMHIGLLTAIMLGGSSFTQLLFSPYLQNKSFKKKHLLFGINARIASLAGLSLLFFFSVSLSGDARILFIFILITIFAFSGAFANISYTDILGKSVLPDSRKSFFSIKQVLTGSGVLISAFFARRVLMSRQFPENYTFMFLIAAVFLGLASIGFWRIKETVASGYKIKGLKAFLNAVRVEIQSNSKLKYYLSFVNTLGISVAIFPFLILYAKENYQVGSSEIGRFLIFKVTGVVATGMLLFFVSKKIRYRYLLYSTVLLTLFIPLFVMISNGSSRFFWVFFVGGIAYSLYTISINGVLLEVSDNQNRALYTGIAGAGNILPTLFPISAGWIIKAYGFNIFFIIFMVVVTSSLFFIYKLHCNK